jgi:hypothetical protein
VPSRLKNRSLKAKGTRQKAESIEKSPANLQLWLLPSALFLQAAGFSAAC